jgi:hypothetical protein
MDKTGGRGEEDYRELRGPGMFMGQMQENITLNENGFHSTWRSNGLFKACCLKLPLHCLLRVTRHLWALCNGYNTHHTLERYREFTEKTAAEAQAHLFAHHVNQRLPSAHTLALPKHQ